MSKGKMVYCGRHAPTQHAVPPVSNDGEKRAYMDKKFAHLESQKKRFKKMLQTLIDHIRTGAGVNARQTTQSPVQIEDLVDPMPIHQETSSTTPSPPSLDGTKGKCMSKQAIEGWPKKTPKPRKYKRLSDLADTPLKGDINEIDANKESPSTKGKYVRKNGINKPEERKIVGLTRSSCRRYLNFDLEGQVHALVPYQRSGAVVPFESSVAKVEVGRKRPPPKVELDDETTRVWKLLLENKNNEGIDGTDEETTKWWEEERRVFRGKTNSFIARMHLVQGNRRFSPWKGSVLDSVIGVFLTQNVADHLSSSAFMSLASHFSFKQEIITAELHKEKTNTNIDKVDACVMDLDGISGLNGEVCNKTVHDEDLKTLHHFGCNETRETKSVKLLKTNYDGISEDNLRGQFTDISKKGLVMTQKSAANKWVSMLEDKRDNDDALSSQASMISLQNSADSSVAQTTERTKSSSQSNLEEEPINDTSIRRGLSTAESRGLSTSSESESQNIFQMSTAVSFKEGPNLSSPSIQSSDSDQIEKNIRLVENKKGPVEAQFQENNCKIEASNNPVYPKNLMDATGGSCNSKNSRSEPKDINLNKNVSECHSSNKDNVPKSKVGRIGKLKQDPIDWDSLRRHAQGEGRKRERTVNTMDSADWDAVRCAKVDEIAGTIIGRGMHNRLAQRIKDFLNRIFREHGSLDLEWLRDVPPDKAKEYLLSVEGLGLKSVECVRLLTLHHLAFPVDTNVRRIAVRLGWVPLQPLPDSLQLHLLESYPESDSVQKYLWPRLCKLDLRTLYELHYQMITFGKVFCTKDKPNCNACPMRGECQHFASEFASARHTLAEEKSITYMTGNKDAESEVNVSQPIIEELATLEPTIEVPGTPEPSCSQVPECEVESNFSEDPHDIPCIQLDMEDFVHNLKNIIQPSTEILDANTSMALVALTPEAALIPIPKLKNVSQLRTEHQVYELPDSHPLLEGMDKREAGDPCPYLLAIWTPGETMNSIKPPERQCSSQDPEKLCTHESCSSCNSIREANSRTVRGTLLIPCRTAMRGSFPLNGTFFQVNEVFTDHESSLCPMDIPREWLWNLPRRTVYFGTSIPMIFRGLSTEEIQYCFWKGFVCIRGFDRETRAPRPLIARMHFPASKLGKRK